MMTEEEDPHEASPSVDWWGDIGFMVTEVPFSVSSYEMV